MTVIEIVALCVLAYVGLAMLATVTIVSIKETPGKRFTNKTIFGIAIMWPIFVLRYVLPLFVIVPVFIGQSVAAGLKELP